MTCTRASGPTTPTSGGAVSRPLLALLLVMSAATTAAEPPQTLPGLARAGQREAVLAAITSPDINVNQVDEDGATALLWATHAVDRELVRGLLQAGAKPDIGNRYGATPLAEAVKLADVALVTQLL